MAKTKYMGLDYADADTVLDASAAMVQAARALDVSAELAVECKDTETLTTVAALWIKIGETLGEGGESEESKPPDKNGLGFTVSVEKEDDSVEADNSNSGS
jgi:hypothetical protein